jgi:tripartite-type tricarboxylate transporter receptor subunit TctC
MVSTLRIALLFAALVCLPASAQQYPHKSIRFIVPFAPGAATDITARTISDRLAASLGQPLVIENQGTASGIVGTDQGAKAAPDGYTWVLAHDPPFTVLPHLRTLPYDPLKDFEPVSMIANVPMVLVIRPSLPVNNIQELLAMARAEPGKLTIASSGSGATSHLAAELFKYETKIDLLHVPYKGQAQAVTDVLGGQVDMIFSSFGPVIPHIKTGKLKALGISVPRRFDSLPGVPTISESGVPGFDFSIWTGIAMPAGTPKAIRDEVNAAVTKALEAPEVRERFTMLGYVPVGGSADVLKKKIVDDYAKWGRILKAANVKLD